MENAVSTNLVHVNFDVIRRNYLNRTLWKKSWKIFDYDGYVAKVSLYSINVYDNSVQMVVQVIKNGDVNNAVFSIPLEETQCTQEYFERQLNASVRDALLEYSRYNLYRNDPRYKDLRPVCERAQRKARKEAIAYLKAHHITNKEVRKVYIEKYVNEHAKSFWSAEYDFRQDNKKLWVANIVVMYYMQANGSKDIIKEYRALSQENVEIQQNIKVNELTEDDIK